MAKEIIVMKKTFQARIRGLGAWPDQLGIENIVFGLEAKKTFRFLLVYAKDRACLYNMGITADGR